MQQLQVSAESLYEALAKIRSCPEAISGLIDPRTPFLDEPGFGWLSRAFGYVTTVRDRADGRFIPIYDNELDLRALRMASRLLGGDIPVAEAMKRRLVEYTISSGFDWEVKHPSNPVQTYFKTAIDETLRNCKWSELEVETFGREFEDGEALGAIVKSSGSLSIEVLEPEYLTEPANANVLDEYYDLDGFESSWSFGVATRKNRTDIPLAYHICRDGVGIDWDVLKPKNVFHWKRNVTRNAKRGVPDAYRTIRWLKHAEKVANNTAVGTAIQAAIAYIVEHAEKTTSSEAQKIAENRFNSNAVIRYDYTTGQQYTRKDMRPGTVVDVKNGGKYHASLLGQTASNIYIEVMDALFRLAGTVYAFPESMVTGYAGNNNRASSETAESPFIQGRKLDQRRRAEQFRDMLYTIAEIVCESSGWDWEQVKPELEIIVQPPDIVNRDIGDFTTALAAQKAQGWISDQLAVQMLGYSYKDVKSQIDTEQKEAAERQAAMPRTGFQGANPSQDQGDLGQQQPPSPDQPDPEESDPFQEGFDPLKHPRQKDGKFAPKPKVSKPVDSNPETIKRLTEAAKTFQHKGIYGTSEWLKKKSGVNSQQAIDAIDARAKAFAMHLQEMGLVKASKVSLDVSKAEKNHRPNIEKARQWLSAMGATSLQEAQVVKAQARRDSYENGKIYVAGVQAFPSAVIHEYGHHLEMTATKLQHASSKFVEDRISERGLERVPMSRLNVSYGPDQVGAKGFTNAFESEARGAYAAIRYPQGGSELIAMGLEAMYANPVRFIKADPEFAAFILEQIQ